jgi:ATP-dependent exoDNAse (exonuclease V) alpha subunit
VVIYDLANFSATFTRNDLYVAWTRARHRLIVVCHGAELRASVKNVLAQAEQLLRSASSQ